MDYLKFYAKNDNKPEDLLSILKSISDDIEIQFGRDKYGKVTTIRRSPLVMSKNINLDRNMEIKELEHSETYTYFEIIKRMVSMLQLIKKKNKKRIL